MVLKSIYAKAKKMGLSKSAEFNASIHAHRLTSETGRATRFQPGHASWNKGTHYEAGGRSAETRFKPGHRGGVALEVYQPVGSERISKDGYIQRKINDDMPFHKRWRGVHILNWEAVNGPLPSGHALVFRDGNKQNTGLDNLELVTRSDLMKRNSFHNYGKEVAQLVQLRSAISRQINKRKGKTA